ncbi:LysR family transcriptional regulator [Massilia sp. TS11]|uniref:LysR family transcriptional regulator n=1 Tax=Massilia sp. TS11 TaxID=2908003 RepID=UPI001EDA5759|nr:LysR family transcriptional regulator [Massilia sp. TS11]MCG2585707.1 LysR family transcriptional regulator [Massilia sp. TS11]
MELRHLRYFIAVAEELHFTRAAQRLNIGQPPLSHAIAQLEEEVGALLFERSKRWVRLTPAGSLFLSDARRILALAEQAQETARRAERGEAGELRIGFTYSTPFTPLFVAAIRRYRQQYPGVTLTLRELSSQRQIEALAQRELDLAFTRPLSVPDARLAMAPLRDDPLVAVLPSEHRLAHTRHLALRDLANEPFVMYPAAAGTAIVPLILRLCRAAGFSPHVAQEAGESASIIGLVAAGCGVTVLPATFRRIRMEGVSYRQLQDADARTSLMLGWRAGEHAPLVDAFVAIARAAAASD